MGHPTTETVVAVDVGGVDGWDFEGERGSGGDGRSSAAGEAEDFEDVARSGFQIDVAVNGGDGVDGQLGRGKGEQEGERVVDAAVGVDDNTGHLFRLTRRKSWPRKGLHNSRMERIQVERWLMVC